jgi:hypothetical protein
MTASIPVSNSAVRVWLGQRDLAHSGWLGSTNGSPQRERSLPERMAAWLQSYARLAGAERSETPATQSTLHRQEQRDTGRLAFGES